jgi:hypothetical protein
MTLPFFFTALLAVGPLGNPAPPQFHVPADPRYGIVDSVLDSVRFTLGKALALELEGQENGGGSRGR